MARDSRFHLGTGVLDKDDLIPKHLSKLEFARRLNQLMLDKGWNQSELARQADIGRDAVSTYIRGRSFPEPKNLKALADALGISSMDLLPNSAEKAVDRDEPALEIKEAAGHPGWMWLRINRRVTQKQALQIMQLLSQDEPDR